ncbi:uncharacterized protein VTP21DRAFT_6355 [Calcarisporiella thermophila]|uniref:uncharacterized protein n=1 Tax=Calcarisporiella thermophila TaxID=911321 RepID=UPI003742C90C
MSVPLLQQSNLRYEQVRAGSQAGNRGPALTGHHRAGRVAYQSELGGENCRDTPPIFGFRRPQPNRSRPCKVATLKLKVNFYEEGFRKGSQRVPISSLLKANSYSHSYPQETLDLALPCCIRLTSCTNLMNRVRRSFIAPKDYVTVPRGEGNLRAVPQ